MIDENARRVAGRLYSSNDRSIERRDAVDLPHASFVDEFVIPNRPVIVSNAAAHWRALETWTPDYFASAHGSKMVEVSDGVTMRFADFVEAVQSSTPERPAPYLHKLIITRDMPELLPDVTPGTTYGYPGRLRSPLMPRPWNRPDGYLKLLLGGRGGRFPFTHYDSDNAYAMITGIYGLKEFVLVSPSDSPFLYPKANGSNVSDIPDLSQVEIDRFPLFARASLYRGAIGPGDAIFIPARWWHAARVVETSISVCTNSINAYNWKGFVDEVCRPTAGRSSLRQFGKRFVLSAIGVALSGFEEIQHRAPASNIARVLDHLSPRFAQNGGHLAP